MPARSLHSPSPPCSTSDADYRRFRAWAADCAHRWFAWTAPESGSVHTGARARRRRRDCEYTARIGGDGARRWEAALTLEGVGL